MSAKIKSIDPKTAAELYGLNIGTLANLRSKKQGPRYFHVNRKVLYFVEDIEAWIKRNPVMTIDSIPEEKMSK